MSLTPFDIITQDEHEMIRTYIRQYAVCGEEGPLTDIAPNDVILRFWNEAKSSFLFKLFREKLILCKKIEIEYNLQELINIFYQKILNSELANSYWNWLQGYTSLVGGRVSNIPDYWDEDDCRQTLISKGRIFSFNNLIPNRWKEETTHILLANGKDIKVEKNCKISKILSKINFYYPHQGYDKFRCILSELSNYKTRVDYLTLSIHPLDYMTMSDNDESWTSCMNWRCAGEYRAGTVEMMNSPCVIVAYLNSPDKDIYDAHGIHWNSKRWRSLFILDKDFIRSVNAYPYPNEKLENEIFHWLTELYQTNCGITLEDSKKIKSCPTYTDTHGNTHQNSVFLTELMYNDTVHRDGRYIGILPVTDYYYSGITSCMWCGCPRYDSYTAHVCCQGCDPCQTCCCCGRESGDIELIEGPDGAMYCSDCYWDCFFECEGCYNIYTYNKEEQYEIAFYKERSKGIEDWRNCWSVHYFCKNCWDNFVKNVGYAPEYNEQLKEYVIYLSDFPQFNYSSDIFSLFNKRT